MCHLPQNRLVTRIFGRPVWASAVVACPRAVAIIAIAIKTECFIIVSFYCSLSDVAGSAGKLAARAGSDCHPSLHTLFVSALPPAHAISGGRSPDALGGWRASRCGGRPERLPQRHPPSASGGPLPRSDCLSLIGPRFNRQLVPQGL